jgi:hypothetical protein
MTNKKMLAFIAVFVSVLGFAFIEALKPVIINYSAKQYSVNSQYLYTNEEIQTRRVYFEAEDSSSKMINMLSNVLGIDQNDIEDALQGGTKPNELLISNGIFLSDLSEEYSFDIVGEELVRFRV